MQDRGSMRGIMGGGGGGVTSGDASGMAVIARTNDVTKAASFSGYISPEVVHDTSPPLISWDGSSDTFGVRTKGIYVIQGGIGTDTDVSALTEQFYTGLIHQGNGTSVNPGTYPIINAIGSSLIHTEIVNVTNPLTYLIGAYLTIPAGVIDTDWFFKITVIRIREL